MATITGTNGNDTSLDEIAGGGSTQGDDEIFGLDGNDYITMYENYGPVINNISQRYFDRVHGGNGLDSLRFTINNPFTFTVTQDDANGIAGTFSSSVTGANTRDWNIDFDGIEYFYLYLNTSGTLAMGSSRDVISALSSSTISGGGGDDALTARGSGNTLNGDDGNDYFDVYMGGNTINGGAGNDQARFQVGGSTNTATMGTGSDRLEVNYFNAPAGVYLITPLTVDPDGGYQGAYYVSGGYARVNFSGVEHFNVFGGASGDTLAAGNGDDQIVGNAGNDSVTAGRGNDILYGGDDIDALSIDLSDETVGVTINLLSTEEQQTGGAGIIGGFESFTGTVTGSAFDDVLTEGRYDYDATFNMGAGNDTVKVSDGIDTINGEAGRDRLVVDYSLAESNVYMITALSGNVTDGYSGAFYISGGYARANFSGIENFTVTGGASGDTISTGDGNDVVATGLGDDKLTAGAGNDSLNGGDGVDALSVSLADETQGVTINLLASGQQQSGGLGSLRNFESFVGTVTGSAFGDTLSEGRYDFDATFNMGGGNDSVKVSDGTDTINGEAGNDRLIVDYSTAESRVYLITALSADANGGYQGAYYIAGGYARANFSGIENFTVTGGVHDDALAAGDGNDTLSGGDGSDSVTAGKGVDTLDGGAGTDALSIDLSDDTIGVRIDLLAVGAQQTGGAGSITGFESFTGIVTGSAGNDALVEGRYNYDATFNMGNGNDSVQVSDGTDTINGEAGNDRLVVDYSLAESNVYLIAALSADTAGGYKGAYYISGGYARANFTGIENFTITGGASGDTLAAGDGNDVLSGGDGNDSVTAGKGNDAVDGGAGTDALSIDLSDETTGVRIDLLATGAQQWGGAGSVAGFESFTGTVTGSARNDVLIEGRYDYDATFNMGAGNDSVQVADGVDTINGEAGTDRLVIDYSMAESTVYLITAISGTLAAGYSGAYYISGGYARANFSGIENFTVTGGASADTLAAGDGADVLSGNAGNDTITAAGGDDLVLGGAGDDTLNGGSGTDTVSYADATDAVTVALATTTAQATGGAGSDTLSGFENLAGSAFADTLTGTSDANTLIGLAGDDLLDGGAGRDRMEGGAGDDRYLVDQTSDSVIELADAGYDRVTSSAGYTLGANVEALTLTGANAIDGTGNVLANAITGNDAANVLKGSGGDDVLTGNDGNDTLSGGAGADTMTGGAGNDQYAVDNAGDVVTEVGGQGYDTVKSTIDYVLGSEVEKLILGNGAIGGTGNTLDNLMVGGRGNNDLSGAGGDDTIDGGQGRDRLTGGAGADRFLFEDGDTGADAASADRILDFSHADGDKIVLRAIDAIPGGADDAFTFIGTSAFSGTAGQLRYSFIASGADTLIEGDINGDGAADFAIRLVGHVDLVAGDFSL